MKGNRRGSSDDEESMREHEFFDQSEQERGVLRPDVEEMRQMRELYNREKGELHLRRSIPRIPPKEHHSQQERSSSPFIPDSSNRDESFTPTKYDQEALQMLTGLIRSNDAILRDPDQRGNKIRELTELSRLPVDFVRRRVSDFLRRGRMRAPSSEQHSQTIYRKTEMFDDAIKRVLRVTPYACINDLRQEIYRKLGLELAKETLIRRLKNLNYVYTKFSLDKKEPTAQDPALNAIRHTFVRIHRQLVSRGSTIYFYGTCHVAVDQCRGSMWMKTRQDGQLDHVLREEDVLVISIILSRGRLEYYRIFRGFNQPSNYITTVRDWLEARSRLRPSRGRSIRHYLAVEANTIHEGTLGTRDQGQPFRDSGVSLLVFPPDSYSLNPAEAMFHQLKYQIKSRVKIAEVDFHIGVERVLQANTATKNTDIDFVYEKMDELYEKWKSEPPFEKQKEKEKSKSKKPREKCLQPKGKGSSQK